MNAFDISELMEPVVGLNVQTISSDVVTSGGVIDLAGYEGCLVSFFTGTLTDGTYTPSLYAGDESDMSDEAVVDSTELTDGGAVGGSFDAFAATDDNSIQSLGYIGKKRYIKLKVTSASTSSGGVLGGTVTKGLPRHVAR